MTEKVKIILKLINTKNRKSTLLHPDKTSGKNNAEIPQYYIM